MTNAEVLICLGLGAAGFCAMALLTLALFAWAIRCDTRRRERRERENVVWFQDGRRLTVRDLRRQRERAESN